MSLLLAARLHVLGEAGRGYARTSTPRNGFKATKSWRRRSTQSDARARMPQEGNVRVCARIVLEPSRLIPLKQGSGPGGY